jgi:hypothetical protein
MPIGATQRAVLRQRSDPIPDSGVARYEFEQNVLDSWGAYDGTRDGATFVTNSAVGSYAISFDGENDYVGLPNFGNTFDGGSGWAVSFWVNIDTHQTGIFELKKNYYGPYIFQSGGVYDFRVYDGSTVYECSSSLTTGTWYHVVIQATGDTSNGSLELFIDDTLEDSTATWGTQTDSDVNQIGARGSSGSRSWFDGQVDDFRIYGKGLSSSEISNLFNTGSI